MAKSGEYYMFDEVVNTFVISESKLKRLVSEGEIRAFREGDQFKFRKSDVENLDVAAWREWHRQYEAETAKTADDSGGDDEDDVEIVDDIDTSEIDDNIDSSEIDPPESVEASDDDPAPPKEGALASLVGILIGVIIVCGAAIAIVFST